MDRCQTILKEISCLAAPPAELEPEEGCSAEDRILLEVDLQRVPEADRVETLQDLKEDFDTPNPIAGDADAWEKILPRTLLKAMLLNCTGMLLQSLGQGCEVIL